MSSTEYMGRFNTRRTWSHQRIPSGTSRQLSQNTPCMPPSKLPRVCLVPLVAPIHTTCFQGNCGEWDFECESRDRNSGARQTGHSLSVRPAINRRAHLTEYKVKIVWVTKGATGKEAIAESGQRTAFSRNRSGERECVPKLQPHTPRHTDKRVQRRIELSFECMP